MPNQTDYFKINDYGMIGDLHTAAIINPEGGIDWLCLPYFDSPSLFAKVLDKNIGGSFQISPKNYSSSHTRYSSNTNILQTTFMADRSQFLLTDFMPILQPDGSKPNPEEAYICRQLECIKGTNQTIDILFDPRPNYARDQIELDFEPYCIKALNFPLELLVDHPVEWNPIQQKGQLTLSYGDVVHFILYYGKRDLMLDPHDWVHQQRIKTRDFWEGWLSKCHYRGRWKRAVERSALTIKMMVFQPTGAIIAAPTTSLPESIGGSRNWDYRFSWLRDSSLALEALFKLGYTQEAEAYMHWIMKKTFPDIDNMHILYPIRDNASTTEKNLAHLEGYRKSAPVRIGNGAFLQFQLDVYGELLETLYQFRIFDGKINPKFNAYIAALADQICKNWTKKDEGIWETRGGQHHFTHSKILCWVGLDRAIQLSKEFESPEKIQKWKKEKDKILKFITEQCVHPTETYLVQSPESFNPDASNLLASITRMLPANHPIIQNTIQKTIDQLTKNRLVFRYRNNDEMSDGFSEQEGCFNICTFWLVEALTKAGRVELAMDYYNHMLEIANYLGLYAEETDPDSLEGLGNFPQAFTHIGLIHAALSLNEALKTQNQ